jgi:hypothetical protein
LSAEELKKLSEKEFGEQYWQQASLAQWIYDTWKWSFIGSLLALTGVTLSSVQLFN